MLQETNIKSKEKEENILKEIKRYGEYKITANNGSEEIKGIGTAIIWNAEKVEIEEKRKKEGRYQEVIMKIKETGKRINLHNIYAPVYETARKRGNGKKEGLHWNLFGKKGF